MANGTFAVTASIVCVTKNNDDDDPNPPPGAPRSKTAWLVCARLVLKYACNLFKSGQMTSEIVPGEDFDVLKLNLRSKNFKSFVQRPNIGKQKIEKNGKNKSLET